MSRRTRLAVCCCAVAVGLLAGFLSLPPATAAADPDPQEGLIRAQLEAGEFAPALAAARVAATVDKRDAWLAQIAAAQAQVGARDASLRTVAEIYDDRTRTQTLAGLATEPLGGRGGGTQADFDALIELITATIEPASWDTVGGSGSIAPFETGVRIDAQGVLQPLLRQDETGSLEGLRASHAAGAGQEDVRQSSPLRKLSLSRLEKHVQLRQAAGRRPTEAMQVLAGLQRIQYVFVYPDSGDIVLAGPAGNWHTDEENRIVSTESGQPVLRLDDLVVVLRQTTGGGQMPFGCLIVPRQEALASLKAFLDQPAPASRPGPPKEWVEQLRTRLGRQDIEVYGLDPRTRAARVLVEADYRMKLVGMGLEEGTPDVKSYLDLIEIPPARPGGRGSPPSDGRSPLPMGVLRWWFTLNYEAVLASQDRQAFAIRGQGVKVLSENELLTAEGQRVQTGESEPLNRQFAQGFTDHFAALCKKYPVYADLRNICDLALVGALIRAEDLPDKTGWHMTFFADPQAYQVELGPAPKQVETVANYRVIRAGNEIHTIAGVSGGVRVDPAGLVGAGAIEIDRYGALNSTRSAAGPKELPLEAWWWD